MIWADRVGLAWALIVGCFVLTIPHPNDLAVLAIIAPWLLLRALDFIFTGGGRRSGPASR